MPIYEYECQKCGHTLEALQKFSDKPLRECPECGRHTLKRLMSAPLFRLAGSGWYETDFKSDKEKKRNLADSAGASGSDKAGDNSSAKPATEKSGTGSDKPKPTGDKKPAKGKGNEAA